MNYEIFSVETLQRISKALEINKKIIEEYQLQYGNQPSKLLMALREQNKILRSLNESKPRDIREIYK